MWMEKIDGQKLEQNLGPQYGARLENPVTGKMAGGYGPTTRCLNSKVPYLSGAQQIILRPLWQARRDIVLMGQRNEPWSR